MIKRNNYTGEESMIGTGAQWKLINREENGCAGNNSKTELSALPYAA